MNRSLPILMLAAAASCLLCGPATEAALFGRLPTTSGGTTTYQAYWDDTLNVTWLANANLADTQSFGVGSINPNGSMTWDVAQSWINAMNSAFYLGFRTWGLPTVSPVSGGNFAYGTSFDGSTDDGYRISAPGSAHPGATGSRMANLYYNTLGNLGAWNPSANGGNGGTRACASTSPNYCLTSSSPFQNVQAAAYWSVTQYGPDPSNKAWDFYFDVGSQQADLKTFQYFAWPALPGDFARSKATCGAGCHQGGAGAHSAATVAPMSSAVPLPTAGVLFLSGLMATLLRWRRRVRRAA